MSFSRILSGSFVALSLSSVVLACGTGGSGGSDASGGSASSGTSPSSTGTGTHANTSFTCCINQAPYACPDQAAFDKCSGGIADVAACHAACGPDPSCHAKCDGMIGTPDPSACVSAPKLSCKSTSCNGVGFGKCDLDADCGSNEHCTKGACFSNDAGSSCDIDADCGAANHCTQGCCHTDTAGSPCDIDADCGAGTCENGTCSG